MLGQRTGLVLGAGASYCYAGGTTGIPIQHDLVGRLFAGHDTGGPSVGFPSLTGPAGPMHSFRLGQYLRSRFDIPEDPNKRNAKVDFWLILQERGYNLETLYAELEAELQSDSRSLLDDFEAIVRTAVSSPVGERGVESVCPFHRLICEALEPGDYIVDFNWDSVMVDALLYYSHFWFPFSGFGLNGVNPLLPTCQKSLLCDSLVQFLPVHGSVVLFELDKPDEPGQRGLLYLGPRQWSAMSGWLKLHGVEAKPGTSGGFPHRPDLELQEERLLTHGHLYLGETWFKPLFIPPSRHKPQYKHWYFSRILHLIHSFLPGTRRFVVAGYSFPLADQPHLRGLFVPEVLRSDAVVEVVNPQNDEEGFRERVREVFPTVSDIRFDQKDFREYCRNLPVDYPDRSGETERNRRGPTE